MTILSGRTYRGLTAFSKKAVDGVRNFVSAPSYALAA